MSDRYQLGKQVCSANRRLFPVIRVREQLHQAGGFLCAEPVAMLIEEEESWFFLPIVENIREEIVHHILPPPNQRDTADSGC